MYSYAQTNIQLFNELPVDIYTSPELRRLRAAYDLAVSLVTGRFQASGKPLLAHFVGVASILNAHGAPTHLVAAGLIHAVYKLGDFGCRRRGISDAKRRVVRTAVGDEVEAYVARYETMPWGHAARRLLMARLGDLDAFDRDVVLLRLANHLEHQLDLNAVYHGKLARRDYTTAQGDLHVALAEKLGPSKLADEMRRAYARAAGAELPRELRGNIRTALIAPQSYRRRLKLRLQERLTVSVARWRSVITDPKRLVGAVRRRCSRLGASST